MLKTAMNLFSAIVALVKLGRDPNRTDQIFRLVDSLPRSKADAALAAMRKNPHVDAVLTSRPRMTRLPSMQVLEACPEGSLGRAVATFFRDNNLDPDIFPDYATDDELEYIKHFMSQTHDVRHVLLGYGSDPINEIRIQAFDAAQFGLPLPPILIAMTLLEAAVKKPDEIVPRLDAITEGFRRGRVAANMFGVDVNAMIGEPLESVRSRFGLVA
jgi:ubiquinone biosynthesis protein COQ4